MWNCYLYLCFDRYVLYQRIYFFLKMQINFWIHWNIFCVCFSKVCEQGNVCLFVWLFVCLFVSLFVCMGIFIPRKNFSIIWRCQHYQWRTASYDSTKHFLEINFIIISFRLIIYRSKHDKLIFKNKYCFFKSRYLKKSFK